jgi:hypothetical protein
MFLWFLRRGVIITKDNLDKRNGQRSKLCCFSVTTTRRLLGILLHHTAERGGYEGWQSRDTKAWIKKASVKCSKESPFAPMLQVGGFHKPIGPLERGVGPYSIWVPPTVTPQLPSATRLWPWPSRCSYKKRHNTTSNLCEDCPSQPVCGCLTKNSIQKPCGGKMVWRKERARAWL